MGVMEPQKPPTLISPLSTPPLILSRERRSPTGFSIFPSSLFHPSSAGLGGMVSKGHMGNTTEL